MTRKTAGGGGKQSFLLSVPEIDSASYGDFGIRFTDGHRSSIWYVDVLAARSRGHRLPNLIVDEVAD